jgi:hypothetical protein
MAAHDAVVKQSMHAWSATLNGSLLRLDPQLEKLCSTLVQLALAFGAPAGALAQLSWQLVSVVPVSHWQRWVHAATTAAWDGPDEPPQAGIARPSATATDIDRRVRIQRAYSRRAGRGAVFRRNARHDAAGPCRSSHHHR